MTIGPMLMHSVTVYTDCPEESYEFYTRVLDLDDQSEHYSSTRPDRWWIGKDTVLIELVAAPEGEMALEYNPISAGVRQVNLLVADISDAWTHLARHDVKVQHGTGDIIVAIAPEGTMIQFCEPRVLRLGLEPRTRGLKVRCSTD